MNSFTIILIFGLASTSIRAQCPDVVNLKTVLAVLQECLQAVNMNSKTVINNPLKPADGTTFTSYIDVTFKTMKKTVKVCCEDCTMEEYFYQMKPLSTASPPMHALRDEPDMIFVHVNTADDTAKFAVVMLDVERAGVSPFVLWIKYNIPGNTASAGNIGMPYDGPADSNTLLFILFKQQADITTFIITNYVDTSKPGCGSNRCNFDVSKFKTDNSLTEVGMNWGKPKATCYKEWREFVSTTNQAAYCTGKPNVESVTATGFTCKTTTETGNHSNCLHGNIVILLSIYLLKTLCC